MGNRAEKIPTDPEARRVLERLSGALRTALAAAGKIVFNEPKPQPPADQEKKK